MKQQNIHIGKKNKKTESNVLTANKSHEEEPEQNTFAKIVKDDEISRINKKMLDLTFHDSDDRTGTKQ